MKFKPVIKMFCMSHLGWIYTNNKLCPKCGSAMVEMTDMT